MDANNAYGAGIYGCDPHRVLDVLARGRTRTKSRGELPSRPDFLGHPACKRSDNTGPI
ncbi:hypothetical protein ACWELJ_09040 [Nocardia sp. NPDC004582]